MSDSEAEGDALPDINSWESNAPPISRSRSGSISRLFSFKGSRRISKTFQNTIAKEFLAFKDIMEKKAKDLTELDFVRQFARETDSLKRRFFPHEEDYEREQYSWEEMAVQESETVEQLLEKDAIKYPRPKTTTTLPWRTNPSKSNVRFKTFGKVNRFFMILRRKMDVIGPSAGFGVLVSNPDTR